MNRSLTKKKPCLRPSSQAITNPADVIDVAGFFISTIASCSREGLSGDGCDGDGSGFRESPPIRVISW